MGNEDDKKIGGSNNAMHSRKSLTNYNTNAEHDSSFLSEDSFVSTRPPPAPPSESNMRSFSLPSNNHMNDVASDNESYMSALPTPNLNVDGSFFTSPNTSRKASLRFKLPESSAAESTPPTTSSSAFHNHKITSPFMDQNVITEGKIYSYSGPQSPFMDQKDESLTDSNNDFYEMDLDDGNNLDNEDAITKRHRWGTRRNKKGVPKKETVSRSKTLRGMLRKGSTHGSKKGRRDSTARSTDNSINEDSESDEESLDTEPKDPRDFRSQKRSIVFNKPLPEEFLDPETKSPMVEYVRNKIRTTKYTPLSFLPKNIYFQFGHNIANVYFLFLIILGAFSIFGVPSPILSAVPLIVIVIITAIKDAIEDSRRTITDMEINNQITHILDQNPHQASNSEFKYLNYNVSEKKISLWRRFKKANSRLLFRFIDFCRARFTKSGRAQRAREAFNQIHIEEEAQRKSFDSDNELSPRPTNENPFSDQVRKSFQSHRQSSKFNHAKSLKFVKKQWKDVRVGDMLRIYNNDELPADLIILSTSDQDNGCYVETKSLDGETNLKVRQAMKYGSHEDKIKKSDDLIDRQFQIDSEGPHPNLYSYQGNLKYMQNGQEMQEPITINNVLLRGCILRNTKWVVGIVAFTGADTKIMLNAGVTPTKQSRISRELNYYVILNFVILFIICFVSGLVNGLWYTTTGTSRNYYEFGTIAGTPAKNGLVEFFVALILYQSLVPISLYITIEIIKTAQAFFIYSDVGMYYEKLDYPCTPKSWSISDDVGQIEYVFSDKTGTLTQNVMEFKKCTINGVSYGRAYTEALAGMRKRQGYDVETEAIMEKKLIAQDRIEMIDLLRKNSPKSEKYDNELSFVSSDFVKDLNGRKGEAQSKCNEHFMKALALCHSVLIEADPEDPNKTRLMAQSPDEAALVGTARSLGYSFEGNTKKGLIVSIRGVTEQFQILNTLEFNSTRKRMSAILKIPATSPNEEPTALLICKGADSIIYDRLSKDNDQDLLSTTSKHLEEYATEGLRTLCIAQKVISWKDYTKWNATYQEAASSLDDREAKIEKAADFIERDLILLGGTAIEDRLQDGVPESIAILATAGIKLWVLTGDKVETAINIGFSCNLLGNDMELLVVKPNLSKEEYRQYNISTEVTGSKLVDELISYFLSTFFNMEGSVEELEAAVGDHSPPNEGFGVVIDGDALKVALADAEVKRKFLLLCKQCKSVLCCRVSPAQKAAVVKLVKDTLDVMTLAIGDGSNDVAMIQAADVGVGIAGEEGRQAVMSSDYAIGQFRFLVKLVLTHGRWSYKRFSEMIPSFFYKNIIFSIALFWYGIYDNFDGTYLFEFTYLTFYNLAFTSLPVIFLGVLDQDVSAKVSILVPQLYKTGILRTEFTQFKFWVYLIDGIYQSAISYFFPYLMYSKGFVSMNGLGIDHRFWIGVVVVSIACISCNLYILFHQFRWDWLSSLIVAISILIVYTWTGLWTAPVYSTEFYKAAPQMFGQAGYWACTFIGVLICLMPRFFVDFVLRLFWPRDVDIIRECVARGDFDAYPEDYDPTDPNKPKISDYTNERLKRISMSRSTTTSKEFKRKMSSSPNVNQHNINDTGGSSSKVSESTLAVPNHRKSVIDMFKRKSKAASSFFDSGSLIDTYNFSNGTTEDLSSLRTEEIPLEEFNANSAQARRISSDIKKSR